MPSSFDPYDALPAVASFDVRSDDVSDGTTLSMPQVSGIFGSGGEDRSPHLAWSGAPDGTASYAVTCLDPDAPTGSGFWHWVAYDIPASVAELAAGAGDREGSGLPAGAKQLRNDAGLHGYLGASPPIGHGPHRYMFVVHALDVAELPIGADATPAFCTFNLFGTTLARARVTPVYEQQ
ncbi:MAG TPA: YbhB/YbcL family Raf kinase inhibitor-like protein [Acidimicrobiaceae bacterium]|nr:YbhB/YbcL family Raf kinase inhibitor-like protein [Acidimicrobiaceae bacterium]